MGNNSQNNQKIISEIKDMIEKVAEDNKISCVKALTIAKEKGVDPLTVGNILNDLKIKIVSCQLGCFK